MSCPWHSSQVSNRCWLHPRGGEAVSDQSRQCFPGGEVHRVEPFAGLLSGSELKPSPCEASCCFWFRTGDTLPPFSVAYVKGWRRSVSCLIVAEAIRELRIDFSDLTQNYKAGF